MAVTRTHPSGIPELSALHHRPSESTLLAILLLPGQDDWLKRAELAVSKGEDELAREALKRRKAYQVRVWASNPAGNTV